jgi:hypothetical protein
MAAAVGDERHWWAYEAKPVKNGRTLPPAFCSFDPSEASAGARAAGAVREALSGALKRAGQEGRKEGGEEEHGISETPVRAGEGMEAGERGGEEDGKRGGEKAEEEEELYTGGEAVRAALQAAVDAVRAEDDGIGEDSDASSGRAKATASAVVATSSAASLSAGVGASASAGSKTGNDEAEEADRLLALEVQVRIHHPALPAHVDHALCPRPV